VSIPAPSKPQVYIDEASVDGARVNTATPLQLTSGDHELEFKFTALNFSAPEKVRMRHQLVGFETDWVETEPDHLATYRHLPPGNYQMRVTAANEGGAWSDTGASLTFSIAAAWWQSSWFRVIAGLGLATIFILLGRYWSHRRLQFRLRQLEREQQLERERTRIARDLHDDIGASVTQIGLIADRLKRGAEDSTLKNELGQLASHTRRLSGELEGVVWTVSPKNDSWERLASFMRRFALNFFADTSIICSIEGVEGAPVKQVAPEVQHHVLAILKEAANNILKHAHAKQVRIVLSFEGNRLNLSVFDDGIGFDPLAKDHSERNGLNNQRTRAQEIGGMLEILSLPGRGTEVKLIVALDTKLQSNPIFSPVKHP
jgi:signal transduction histidine kinase